jgi:RNA polymerase sigma factor (sigma-70 family)
MMAIMAERDDLVAAAQSGDEQALLELLRVCQPQLRRYADRTCASDDVEEAVQDALWILFRKVGAVRTIGALSGWLFQVVRRECLRRARRRRDTIEWDEKAAYAISHGGRSDEDLRIDLTRALAALPQDYREILVLRDISGFSTEETAQRLGLQVAATKSRLHRARQMLRSLMQGDKEASCSLAAGQSSSIS